MTSAPSRDGVPFTLLGIGDVHLGTRPARLPEALFECGIDSLELTPEAALAAAVDRALAESVDAVIFTGDVVESTNARFEAIRPLELSVRRLIAAGIPVFAVAGNHDVDALPRLARLIEGFRLIGEGGRWETHSLDKGGRPAVEIVGWSFPERRVRSSPVAQLRAAPLAAVSPGVTRIGLLHGDLDASGGVYAPFTRRELEETGLDAWLLGHIHRPSLDGLAGRDGLVPYGYLGSLVGLDRSETGPHGPWRIRVKGPGRVFAELLPIAPLRWEQVRLPVTGIEDLEDVGDRILDAAERTAREIQRVSPAPRALGVRVHLEGTTRIYDSIRRQLADGRWRGITRPVGETVVFVAEVVEALELEVNLEEIAAGDDPPALLARKLLVLDRGDDDERALLESARAELRATASDSCWAPLDDERGAVDPLCDEVLRAHLKRAGHHALHTLLTQRGAEGGENL